MPSSKPIAAKNRSHQERKRFQSIQAICGGGREIPKKPNNYYFEGKVIQTACITGIDWYSRLTPGRSKNAI